MHTGLCLPPTRSFFPVLKHNVLHSSSFPVQLNSQHSLLCSGPCPAWLHPFQSSVTVSELCVPNEDVLVNRSRNDIPKPEQHSFSSLQRLDWPATPSVLYCHLGIFPHSIFMCFFNWIPSYGLPACLGGSWRSHSALPSSCSNIFQRKGFNNYWVNCLLLVVKYQKFRGVGINLLRTCLVSLCSLQYIMLLHKNSNLPLASPVNGYLASRCFI